MSFTITCVRICPWSNYTKTTNFYHLLGGEFTLKPTKQTLMRFYQFKKHMSYITHSSIARHLANLYLVMLSLIPNTLILVSKLLLSSLLFILLFLYNLFFHISYTHKHVCVMRRGLVCRSFLKAKYAKL